MIKQLSLLGPANYIADAPTRLESSEECKNRSGRI